MLQIGDRGASQAEMAVRYSRGPIGTMRAIPAPRVGHMIIASASCPASSRARFNYTIGKLQKALQARQDIGYPPFLLAKHLDHLPGGLTRQPAVPEMPAVYGVVSYRNGRSRGRIETLAI
jgi:hypothetical protein